MRHMVWLAAMIVVQGAGLVAQAEAGSQSIEIGSSSVTAAGMTPGGAVAWLAVSRERPQWVTTVRQWVTADTVADASGHAILRVGSDVPVKSIWIAVDVTTGAFAASSPPAYPWRTQVPFPSAGVATAPGGTGIASIRDEHDDLEVLVVRPKAGAWALAAHHDDPESKGTAGTLVSVTRLTPLKGSPQAPAHLLPGDVIVAIDPERMEYFAQQLGPSH